MTTLVDRAPHRARGTRARTRSTASPTAAAARRRRRRGRRPPQPRRHRGAAARPVAAPRAARAAARALVARRAAGAARRADAAPRRSTPRGELGAPRRDRHEGPGRGRGRARRRSRDAAPPTHVLLVVAAHAGRAHVTCGPCPTPRSALLRDTLRPDGPRALARRRGGDRRAGGVRAPGRGDARVHRGRGANAGSRVYCWYQRAERPGTPPRRRSRRPGSPGVVTDWPAPARAVLGEPRGSLLRMCAQCVSKADVVVGTHRFHGVPLQGPVRGRLVAMGLIPEPHPLAVGMRTVNFLRDLDLDPAEILGDDVVEAVDQRARVPASEGLPPHVPPGDRLDARRSPCGPRGCSRPSRRARAGPAPPGARSTA